MLIKLDMANTFDRVKRSYLYKVFLSYGFSLEFVNLIKACIDKPWIAPLVNGWPANYFQDSRGIRQGCLLSPFMYILMADSLSRKLIAERNVGEISGIRPAKGTDPINHALFVDDSLLLGGSSLRIARAFNEIIQNFCCISGALVNKRKSVVYGWNTNEQTISRIAHILGFKGFVSWDKIKYLGLPLTLGASKSSLWMEVISKFK
jgi:hypothetical protein